MKMFHLAINKQRKSNSVIMKYLNLLRDKRRENRKKRGERYKLNLPLTNQINNILIYLKMNKSIQLSNNKIKLLKSKMNI